MPIEIFNWNDTNINFNIYYFTHVCIKRERLFGQQLLQTLLICYNGTMSQPAATFQGFHHLHYIWLLLHLKNFFFPAAFCTVLYIKYCMYAEFSNWGRILLILWHGNVFETLYFPLSWYEFSIIPPLCLCMNKWKVG